MRRVSTAVILLLLSVALCAGGCDESKKNTVEVDQINSDNSNNYHYIFRGLISEQKDKEKSRKNF